MKNMKRASIAAAALLLPVGIGLGIGLSASAAPAATAAAPKGYIDAGLEDQDAYCAAATPSMDAVGIIKPVVGGGTGTDWYCTLTVKLPLVEFPRTEQYAVNETNVCRFQYPADADVVKAYEGSCYIPAPPVSTSSPAPPTPSSSSAP